MADSDVYKVTVSDSESSTLKTNVETTYTNSSGYGLLPEMYAELVKWMVRTVRY